MLEKGSCFTRASVGMTMGKRNTNPEWLRRLSTRKRVEGTVADALHCGHDHEQEKGTEADGKEGREVDAVEVEDRCVAGNLYRVPQITGKDA